MATEMNPEEQQAYDEAREIILDAVRRMEAGEKVTDLGSDLRNKGLVALPPEIGHLRSLMELTLGGNRLTTLPPEIRHLTALEVLDLGANSFTTLPAEICHLTSLRRLYLSFNPLAGLPAEIGNLAGLRVISLRDTKLTTLPPELGRLPGLEELYLENTPLRELPETLRQCAGLKKLFLHNTPVGREMPAEVLGPMWHEVDRKNATPARPQDILDYYFSTRRSAGPLNEARVLLVGRGEAGKTSLSRALQGLPFNSDEKETQGVEIRIGALRVRCGAGSPGAASEAGKVRDISLHLWDFAGQEITYALHRFFLAPEVIYLLVLDNRADLALADAEDWLRTIAAYGKDAPVVVALTKQDMRRWDIDEEELRDRWADKFASLTFVRTDARSRLGVDELKRVLTGVAAGMPEVGRLFPVEYRKAKERFERMKETGEKRLGLEEFKKICLEEGIKDDVDDSGEVVALAGDRAEGLARILHQLGVVLHYAADARLRDNAVLDPQWVTNGVYSLLRALEADGEPRLTLAGARKILPKEDRDGLLFLLRLMERFEMIYPVDVPDDAEQVTDAEADARTVWLMPAVLPVNQPKLRDDSPWRQKDETELRLRFTYALLPEGLIPRFIVRTWPLYNELYRWRNGVFLRDRQAEALVRGVKRDRMVEITVRGPEADRVRLARLICRHMEAIHQDVPEKPKGEIEMTVEVGEAEALRPARVEKVWKNIEVLEIDEVRNAKGESSVETSQGSKVVAAGEVLEAVAGKRKRVWDATRRRFPNESGWFTPREETWNPNFFEDEVGNPFERPVRVFVSYSSRDKKVCDVFMQNLTVMEQDGLIEAWTDNLIPSGEDWEEEITRRLEEADLFVALVTTPFLASPFIRDVERPMAMERAKAGKLKLAWVIVEDKCAWRKQDFAKLQVIQPDGRAVRQHKRLQDGFNAMDRTLRRMVGG